MRIEKFSRLMRWMSNRMPWTTILAQYGGVEPGGRLIYSVTKWVQLHAHFSSISRP